MSNTTSSNPTSKHAPKKVCVAYSGGLDTSCIIPWLVETYGCEVVACVADVGQGARELEGIEAKAIRTGAVECRVVDLKKQFMEEFVFPMCISGAPCATSPSAGGAQSSTTTETGRLPSR